MFVGLTGFASLKVFTDDEARIAPKIVIFTFGEDQRLSTSVNRTYNVIRRSISSGSSGMCAIRSTGSSAIIISFSRRIPIPSSGI